MVTFRAAVLASLVVLMTPPAPVPAQVAAPSAPVALSAAFLEVQRIFAGFAERAHLPGASFGIIVDGALAFSGSVGVGDVASKTPVNADTIFRIASMTKSFTAAAILKLRDQGRLSLDDPAEKHVPELSSLLYPSKDSPRITVRHLLSHSAGFPEDNPWGDRQLAVPNDEMSRWMREGIPFSTAPGTEYEYSNYGFAILGQIVQRVSGRPYHQFMRDEILAPLGMTSTTFEMRDVPAGRMAKGYRWSGPQMAQTTPMVEGWTLEPMLAHGSFGTMGGLWTSTRDLAKWVAFMLSAFPPRDEADRGPVARGSLREMQQVSRSIRATAMRPAVDAPAVLNGGGYGYGLRISQTCAFGHLVAHGGGLPGFGSQMQWLPGYGVGIIAMGNVTYAGWGGAFASAWEALRKTGALIPREPTAAKALVETQTVVNRLMREWNDKAASAIAADNLFLDQPAASRKAQLDELRTKHGACTHDGRLSAENALRGTWTLACDRGWMEVAVTLAPTSPPKVQYWGVRSVLPPSDRLAETATRLAALAASWSDATVRQIAGDAVDQARLKRQVEIVRAARGTCRVGELTDGDGATRATWRFECERGAVRASVAVDPATGLLSQVNLAPAVDGACTP